MRRTDPADDRAGPAPNAPNAPNARREALRRLGAGALLAGGLGAGAAARADAPVPRAAPPREIPSSGARVPCIGLGTWLTLDLEPGRPGTAARVDVVRAFLEAGGGVVDSSPMYGYAEAMVGHALARVGGAGRGAPGAGGLFAASKIWTPFGAMAEGQMSNTERLWDAGPMALMQVHNLVGLDAHLPRLREWRAAGRIGHVGVTTSHGRRHAELEAVLRRERLDTVQLTLNLTHRAAEARLLPLAADRGAAVVVNRPLDGGRLPRALAARPLSPLAVELGCTSWAQYCLLFVVSHPAVTVAIPATTRADHVRENVAVAALPMPDAATREAMAREIG